MKRKQKKNCWKFSIWKRTENENEFNFFLLVQFSSILIQGKHRIRVAGWKWRKKNLEEYREKVLFTVENENLNIILWIRKEKLGLRLSRWWWWWGLSEDEIHSSLWWGWMILIWIEDGRKVQKLIFDLKLEIGMVIGRRASATPTTTLTLEEISQIQLNEFPTRTKKKKPI